MRHCKLAHQSQSQDCATFPSHIWSILWKTNSIFYPQYLGLPVLTKYFVTFFFSLSPVEGLHFCYCNLTVVHFYTYNTWESHKKNFSQSFRYGKYLSFPALVILLTVLAAEQFAFPCNVCQTSAEEVLSMSRNQNWSLLRQNNSKSIWRVLNKFYLNIVKIFYTPRQTN